MPELPEVETIRRDLTRVLKGQKVLRFQVRKARLLRSPQRHFQRHLVGATIIRINRRAKQLIVGLSSGYSLLIHLKMTGQLVWRSPRGKMTVGGHPIAGVTAVPNRYTYITLRLSSGGRLYFNDVRQFGYFKLVPTPELSREFSHFGPEPLLAAFTVERLRASLARRFRTTVKAALLDQRIVAGIGNIYADESLYLARLRPSRRVGSLRPVEVSRLWRSIRQVLKLGVAARGTSFSTYRDGLGRQGTYWDRRLVYGRAGESCRRCGTLFARSKVAGRGTTYCSKCQH